MDQAEYKEMEMVENDHFWFVAKRKFLQVALGAFASGQNLRVLDVGCGTGAVLDFLREKGYQVEGVDNNAEAIEYCRAKGLHVSMGAAEGMNYPDESFDVVLALDVLEHLKDDRAALKEIFRVLKKGGHLIATVPAHQSLWSYHDVALHHHRRYSRVEWENLFLGDQFKIKLISWLHACILLPTWIVRKVYKILNKENKGSDVKKINWLVNSIGKLCYLPELAAFRVFKKLPAGVSLLAVVEKK